MDTDHNELFDWLVGLGTPRPLVWQRYVYRRRMWYGFVCAVLLIVLVGIPLFYGIAQITATASPDKVKPNQVALCLGAVIVVSYVLFVHSLFKMYDDIKWLGQRGEIAEANLLEVLNGPKKLIVSYRFWDNAGKEREREAVIDIDRRHPISELRPGMVVPILYDPAKPSGRCYLWAEATNYLTTR